MRFVIGFCFICLLSACATTMKNYYTPTIESWRGASLASLMQVWGVPDKKMAGVNNHVFYVYYIQSTHSYAGPYSPSIGVNVSSTGSPVMTVAPNTNMTWNRGNIVQTCMAIFELDNKAIITGTRMHGNNCYGNQEVERKMSRREL